MPSISKDELMQLPTIQFKGKIHLIDDLRNVKEACDLLLKESLLGFDTETKPSFRKGRNHLVSLLQLSSDSDAFLFRLNKIGLPEMLSNIRPIQLLLKLELLFGDEYLLFYGKSIHLMQMDL